MRESQQEVITKERKSRDKGASRKNHHQNHASAHDSRTVCPGLGGGVFCLSRARRDDAGRRYFRHPMRRYSNGQGVQGHESLSLPALCLVRKQGRSGAMCDTGYGRGMMQATISEYLRITGCVGVVLNGREREMCVDCRKNCSPSVCAPARHALSSNQLETVTV